MSSFSQNAAWTHWCIFNPFECMEFQNDANVALAAINAGNLRPAELFVEKWQQVADRNEETALAIQASLDNIRSALAIAGQAALKPITAGLKPFLIPAVVATALILAWKK
jgi:hypothetical protein